MVTYQGIAFPFRALKILNIVKSSDHLQMSLAPWILSIHCSAVTYKFLPSVSLKPQMLSHFKNLRHLLMGHRAKEEGSLESKEMERTEPKIRDNF